MAKLKGEELAKFAIGKLGTPYVYGAKGSYGPLTKEFLTSLILGYPNVFNSNYREKAKKYIGVVCTDCSGLIGWYTGKNIGSYQMYSTAYTRIPISNYKDFADGVVVWKPGHVGVFFWENGLPYVLEAKGIDFGTVKSKFVKERWSYGLTFDYLEYSYTRNLSSVSIWKKTNPYKAPKFTVISKMSGEEVKWVQWELNESGIKVDIDGVFGPQTLRGVKKFQQSCKIEVDGRVGPETQKCFIAA